MGYHGSSGYFSFGPFRLNPTARVLLRGNDLLAIGSRAFDMLVALVRHQGQVLSHGELMAFAWPGLNVEASNIRVQMTHLRREIGCGENGNRYIVSVAGRGYSFVAPVTWEEASEPDPPCHAALSDDRTCFDGPYAATMVSFPPRLGRPIGRDENISKLSQMVAERRFMTIVGAGGIGKTTLAVLVARALPMFELAYFVDLGSVEDETAVLGAVASALKIPVSASDAIGAIVGQLSPRRILVVLDNCEHVIDAVADIVSSLLRRTSNTHVLATSREALRMPGESVFLLRPLAVPPNTGRLTAAQALHWPAIQLFVERAVDSGYLEPLGDEEAARIAAICRRLDGNPLAIELVASRMGPYGLDRVAQLLDNQLALRWRGSRYANPRHQNAEAMMDWSYALLSAMDQRVFRQLSAFSGEFSLDAALTMMEDDGLGQADTVKSIGNLIDKSLLSVHPGTGPAHLKLSGIAKTYAAFKLRASGERMLTEHPQSLRHVQTSQQHDASMIVSSNGGQAMQLQAS